MDFIDKIRELAERALDLGSVLKTEEATKNALIMPFIQLLGYDVFDPREVVPEYVADVGTKKGEKVDYAILRDGDPIILFECKSASTKLGNGHNNQLWRYFSTVQSARFGVLTNGITYRFFSDIEAENRMDEKPFLEIDLLDIRESLVKEIKKFSKEHFDIQNILSTASELKYTREIKNILNSEYESPSEDFVRFCIADVYSGVKTQSVIEQFSDITKRALHQFVNDHINERLKSALSDDVINHHEETISEQPGRPDLALADDNEGDALIVTTEEEREAFFAIKAILYGTIEPSRVALRDRISYCGILLDDNNRKPICRLHFNRSQKYLGLLNAQKKETRVPISSIDDVYKYADKLKVQAQNYD